MHSHKGSNYVTNVRNICNCQHKILEFLLFIEEERAIFEATRIIQSAYGDVALLKVDYFVAKPVFYVIFCQAK